MTVIAAIILIPLFASASDSRSDVMPAPLFCSDMVLQRNAVVPFWGKGTPGQQVTLTTGWDSKIKVCTVSADSTWRVEIQTPDAGGPYKITLKGRYEVVLNNVMVGDVWLCAGQSNMEWSPYSNNKNGIPDLEQELQNADNYPDLRFFNVKRDVSDTPQEWCEGGWKVSDRNSAKWFTAVGQFFGRELCENLNIPVGLIGSYWGGTGAEVWTPAETVNSDKELLEAAGHQIQDPRWFWPIEPGAAYNAMIHPLTNFPITGVIWYQGESNGKTWWTYSRLLQAMVRDWRAAWGNDFPFYIVQISPLYDKEGMNGCNVLLREQQQIASEQIARSGLVTISDVGDAKDIHPRNKRPVGERLAYLALSEHYGRAEYADRLCPLYDRCEADGRNIRVYFRNTSDGLKTTHGGNSQYFEISGADGIWFPAKAKIEGNHVTVSSSKVRAPKNVRYGWKSLCFPDLVNSAGLPVGAFRSDSPERAVKLSFMDKPLNDFFIGSGVQWSAYPHADSPDAEWGALMTPEKWQMVYGRLDYMKPHIVRVMDFAWWRYYRGLDTSGQPVVEFDNEEVRSLCRLLDWCQSRNVPVMIGEWGTPDNFVSGKGILRADDPRWAQMICAFLKYLIDEKGYDCIRWYNMVNEPNGDWATTDGDWEQWRDGYLILHDEMVRNGLDSRVYLAGPDVVPNYNNKKSPVRGTEWVRRTADSLFSITGLYDVHAYPDQFSIRSGRFYKYYSDLYSMTISAPKPFVFGEIGLKYKGELGTEQLRRAKADPHAGEYDSQMFVYEHFYGVDICDALIQAMCAGYSGAVAWDLDDAMHTVGDGGDKSQLKRWGMWNTLGTEFGNPDDEKLRPWFYSWSLMCRHFIPGMEINAPLAGTADGVRGVMGRTSEGCAIAVVNNSEKEQKIIIRAENAGKRRLTQYLYADNASPADKDGYPAPYAEGLDADFDNGFELVLPPCSFSLLTDMKIN